MNRLQAFCIICFLVDLAAGFAQSPCAPGCRQIDWAPISGRVTDSIDGHPLADARVSYSGRGDALQSLGGAVLNPPSVQGSVRTASDGSYTLPPLPQGSFEVRVSAPKYLSARQYLGEHPVGYHPRPPPLPASICMARTGLPDCPAPALPDGMFKLQPDVLELRPMSSDALIKFVLPGDLYGERRVNAAAFAPDGARVAFITQDPFSREGQAPVRSCVGWTYDLNSGQLIRIAESLPSKYCDRQAPEMAWDDEAVYIHFADYEASPFKEEAMRWYGGEATSWRTQDLPNDFRQALARKAESQSSDEADEKQVEVTADGQFVLISGLGEGRQCNSLSVASKQEDWKQTVSTCSSLSDYLLDRDHDLLVLFGFRALTQQYEPFEKLMQLDFKTRALRSFPVPDFNSKPELLAEHVLADGKTRIAYGVHGNCDPASPDAAHDPPAGEPINPFKALNLCFVTRNQDSAASWGHYTKRQKSYGKAPLRNPSCFPKWQ